MTERIIYKPNEGHERELNEGGVPVDPQTHSLDLMGYIDNTAKRDLILNSLVQEIRTSIFPAAGRLDLHDLRLSRGREDVMDYTEIETYDRRLVETMQTALTFVNLAYKLPIPLVLTDVSSDQLAAIEPVINNKLSHKSLYPISSIAQFPESVQNSFPESLLLRQITHEERIEFFGSTASDSFIASDTRRVPTSLGLVFLSLASGMKMHARIQAELTPKPPIV